MKSEEEKKTRRVPTRMTQAEYTQIRKKAEKRGMSVSAFVVEAAVHSDNRITIPVPNSNTKPHAVPTDKNNHYNNE